MGSSRVGMKWSKEITTTQVEQLIRGEMNLQKAIAIFESASAEYKNGFRHDQKTFKIMISKLVSGNQFRPAEEILKRMKEEKCHINEDIILPICRGYGRIHKPLEAVRIFESAKEFECDLTEKSYITLFSILVDENQLKMALRFYRYMRKLGIGPTVVSLNVLIKALCKNNGTIDSAIKIFNEMPNRGCPPDTYTYGTLISGLCKYGRISEAIDLFREMETKGCQPTVITYSSLIHGLCQSEKLSEAMSLFENMIGNNIKPNVFTYSSLMDGLCKHGCSTHAMELLGMMIDQRLSPNIVTYSTLIHGLCIDGHIREAIELFDRMKLQGLKPDAGLYGKIISGLCKYKKFQEGANFLDEMVLAGISPNRLTWSIHVRTHNMVIIGLCGIDLNRACNLYMSMRIRGLSFEPEAFRSLIKGCCNKGDIQKACCILDEMVCDGCIPDKEVWECILHGFCDHLTMWDSDKMVLDLASTEY